MAQPSPTNPPAPPPNGHPHSLLPGPPISWEGDRMFNVYIHDYFIKRGFRKAAKELVVEADIGPDASPPINARQGFLFEWWNVFWMFFSAKTAGNGSDNIMLYLHWMNERTRATEAARAAGLPVPNQPMPGQHGQNPLRSVMPRPPQAPPNGVRPPGVALPNGTMPMPPGSSQQPPVGPQSMQYPMGALPAGRPPSTPAQPPQQINGIIDSNVPHGMPGPPRPPSQQQINRGPGGPHGPHGPHGGVQTQQPTHPPPSHPNAIPHLQAAPRQVSRGHDTMRPGPYHSPTMPPSHPQNPPPQGSMPHSHMGMNAPMGMGMPPGQHLPQHIGRPPQPPPPPPGSQPTASSPHGPGQAPAQSFQPIMNPVGTMGPPSNQGSGSRSATPATNLLSQRSPAMSAREPQQQQPPGVNVLTNEQMRRFQQPLQPHPNNIPPPSTPLMQPSPQDLANMEQNLLRIPPVFLAQMRQEAGVGERDISTLTYEEKCRLNDVFKRTMQSYNGTTGPPAQVRPNPATNNMNARHMPGVIQQPMAGMPMGPPPPTGHQPRQVNPQQGTNHRGQKRSSTSPADELPADTPKDQSPPDRKRQRQSPQSAPGETTNVQPPMASMGGFPGNPGGFMGPQQGGMPNGYRPGQMGPMSSHTGQPIPNMGGMNMGGMPPNLGHHPMPPGMGPMNPALANQHLHQMPGGQPPHYRPMPPPHIHKMQGTMGVGVSNPNANDGAPNRQPQQNKPGAMMPPPPPSPAHRPETISSQKAPGMMPPPPQPGPSTSANPVGSKEQTAPSPAASRLDGAPTSSPRTRPPSSAGAGSAASNSNPPNSQSAAGNPPTPAPSNNNVVTAPSPSTGISSRISPSAALNNTLSRPQTSGPDTTSSNSSLQTTMPAPSSSAPPTADLAQSLFGDFFSGIEDSFGMGPADDFSQWIDMNGSSI